MKKSVTENKPTATLEIEEFKRISCDIGYEIRMLNKCVESLFALAAKATPLVPFPQPMQILKEDVFQQNLLVEGIAVHSRVLISFLFPPKRRSFDTDVYAYDYYNNTTKWIQNSNDLEQNKLLYECKIWANESLAHMTTVRLNTKAVLDYAQMCSELSIMIDTFVARCPEQEKIDDHLRNWRSIGF